jgi:hypothetical protein
MELIYQYEDLLKLNPDCDLKFLENLNLPLVRGIPYDLIKLFNDTTLISTFAYAHYPNKLTLAFLKFAKENNLIELVKDREEQCKIRLKKEFKEKFREINLKEDEKEKAIAKAQRFYREITKNGKVEFYQDGIEEFPYTFHRNYLEELFTPTHFPFLKNYKYLVIGDDEAKGLFLWEIFKGDIDLTISDIDEDIIRKYQGLGVKAKFKPIDTRHYRNSVWERFDVVISYSLLNPSLSTIKEFLLGSVKDYGVAYISWYPALYRKIEDFVGLLYFWYYNGFWITHYTPYYLRLVKIPELTRLLIEN